ncbi:hypothetical protein GCM10009001_16620 [Virgibacillus siamensis]|uniref:DUF4362 domain-containing protein n=1 Tax=Virgibacillus siamensis TaxID=480071 RepID=A0ABP3R1V1_9BACI
MKNKKQVWFVIGMLMLVIISGIIFVYHQSKTTTFEKVLTNIISKEENIKEVTIRRCNIEENAENDKVMTISNKNELTKFFEQPSDMKLKRTSESNNNHHYIIDMKTGEVSYMVIINDNGTLVTYGEKPIRTNKHQYEITGPNKLVETIKSNENKWELIEKDTGTLESGSLYKFCSNS